MESLEQRLSGLDVRVPPDVVRRAKARAAALTKAPAAARPRAGFITIRRTAVALETIALVLAGNAAAAYFVPRYADALASTPVVSSVSAPLLRYVGLDASSVTPVSDAAVSSGHELRLIGAYADPARTLVLIQFDGKAWTPPTKTTESYQVEASLSDQFGRVYRGTGSSEGAEFQPLMPPASSTGARLTMHVSALLDTLNGQGVAGDWTLHFTLIESPGQSIELPKQVTYEGTTYTFISASRSGSLIRLRWLVTGTASIQAQALIAAGPGSFPTPDDAIRAWQAMHQRWLEPSATDADGHSLMSAREGDVWGYEFPKDAPLQGDMNLTIPKPGRYILAFGEMPRSQGAILIVR